jgi:hypothetical protein
LGRGKLSSLGAQRSKAATLRAQPKLNHKGHKDHKEVFLCALCGLCGEKNFAKKTKFCGFVSHRPTDEKTANGFCFIRWPFFHPLGIFCIFVVLHAAFPCQLSVRSVRLLSQARPIDSREEIK